jgi:hypothetical protein
MVHLLSVACGRQRSRTAVGVASRLRPLRRLIAVDITLRRIGVEGK